MKVLMTGDMGFVGTETKKVCERDGIKVIGYDLMNGFDIRDAAQLAAIINHWKPDRILHLAAIARFSDADADPMLANDTNVIGSINVAAAAGANHIPVIYASTGSVYMPVKETPPITEHFRACGNSVYGCTKYIGERYFVRCSAPYIILRYAHLYGREKRMHGLIGGFLDRINRGLAPTLYGGKQSNDFTYICDVAEANVAALKSPWDKWNHVYNIGTGEELTAEAAGRLICKTFDYAGKIDIRDQRTVDPDRFVFDCRKAEVMLGFKARYSFQQGLEHMTHEAGQELHDLASRAIRAA